MVGITRSKVFFFVLVQLSLFRGCTPQKLTVRPWKNDGWETILSFLGELLNFWPVILANKADIIPGWSWSHFHQIQQLHEMFPILGRIPLPKQANKPPSSPLSKNWIILHQNYKCIKTWIHIFVFDGNFLHIVFIPISVAWIQRLQIYTIYNYIFARKISPRILPLRYLHPKK